MEFAQGSKTSETGAPIVVWTNDGQEVTVRESRELFRFVWVFCRLHRRHLCDLQIEFGVYLRLDPSRLIDLHYKFEKTYLKVAEDIVLNAVCVRSRVCRSLLARD
jgi:hypothetical protein